MLTAKQAADKAGVTDARIRQLAISGEIVGVKPGRDWMIDEDSLEAYMRKRKSPKE